MNKFLTRLGLFSNIWMWQQRPANVPIILSNDQNLMLIYNQNLWREQSYAKPQNEKTYRICFN